jgi:hypothetical protein
MRTLIAAGVMALGVLLVQPAPVVVGHVMRTTHSHGMFNPTADLNGSNVRYIPGHTCSDDCGVED